MCCLKEAIIAVKEKLGMVKRKLASSLLNAATYAFF